MTPSPNPPNPETGTALPKRITDFVNKFPVHVSLVAISVLWTLPSLGLLISSIRPKDDVLRTGWWTVFQHPFDFTQFSLENYTTVLTAEGMGQAFLNSLTIAIPATIIPIAIATFAAYALAWMDFPGRQWLFVMIVALLVVPLQMTFIPILRAYRELGVAGSFLGVWLAHTAYGMPLGIYLLRNYIGSLPRDLIEAAAVDGASHLKIFTRLIVPCRCQRSHLLRCFNSSGSGMICWWRWYIWAEPRMWPRSPSSYPTWLVPVGKTGMCLPPELLSP
jgi:alpha-glucoside transport system permease protein